MLRIHSILVNTYFDLHSIIDDPAMILQRIRPRKEYKDGAYTDNVIGFRYDCVETRDFNHLTISVDGRVPLMSDDQLQQLRQKGHKVVVEFENPRIMAYYNAQTDSIEDTIKAEGVHQVETNV